MMQLFVRVTILVHDSLLVYVLRCCTLQMIENIFQLWYVEGHLFKTEQNLFYRGFAWPRDSGHVERQEQ